MSPVYLYGFVADVSDGRRCLLSASDTIYDYCRLNYGFHYGPAVDRKFRFLWPKPRRGMADCHVSRCGERMGTINRWRYANGQVLVVLRRPLRRRRVSAPPAPRGNKLTHLQFNSPDDEKHSNLFARTRLAIATRCLLNAKAYCVCWQVDDGALTQQECGLWIGTSPLSYHAQTTRLFRASYHASVIARVMCLTFRDNKSEKLILHLKLFEAKRLLAETVFN